MGYLTAFVASDRAGREQILREKEAQVRMLTQVGQSRDMRARLEMEQLAAPGLREATRLGNVGAQQKIDVGGYEFEQKQKADVEAEKTKQLVGEALTKLGFAKKLLGTGPEGQPLKATPEMMAGLIEELTGSLEQLVGAEEAKATLGVDLAGASAEAKRAEVEEQRAVSELGKKRARGENQLVELETQAKKLGLQFDRNVARYLLEQNYDQEKALRTMDNLTTQGLNLLKQKMVLDADLDQVKDEKAQRALKDEIAKAMGIEGGYIELQVRAEVAKLLASQPGKEKPKREFYSSQFRMLAQALSRVEMSATAQGFMEGLATSAEFQEEGGQDMLQSIGNLMGTQAFTTKDDKKAAKKTLQNWINTLKGQARLDYPDVEWGDIEGKISREDFQKGVADFQGIK